VAGGPGLAATAWFVPKEVGRVAVFTAAYPRVPRPKLVELGSRTRRGDGGVRIGSSGLKQSNSLFGFGTSTRVRAHTRHGVLPPRSRPCLRRRKYMVCTMGQKAFSLKLLDISMLCGGRGETPTTSVTATNQCGRNLPHTRPGYCTRRGSPPHHLEKAGATQIGRSRRETTQPLTGRLPGQMSERC